MILLDEVTLLLDWLLHRTLILLIYCRVLLACPLFVLELLKFFLSVLEFGVADDS